MGLRATFSPRAKAGWEFVEALPTGLIALGFVDLESPETLARLLERCPLEHLWFNSSGQFYADMRAALSERAARLRTIALPGALKEVRLAEVAAACPALELLCRMRSQPELGSLELAEDWEPLPGGGGVVLRRRGSTATLAANGALWAPYDRNVAELEAGTI
eukprot:NODE_4615_length_656_cov_355.510815.p2 GENE.NODE_4615_length_656_cov_355.510815~~NODE_4615_length_656_cov_355.510815.p2  ORF type:complete len:162 (+),score=52.40 NODE_4615_length_656_cov_355.510815:3-488(+)